MASELFCSCCGLEGIAGYYQSWDGPLHVNIFPLCDPCLSFAEGVTADIRDLIEQEKMNG